MAEPSRKGANLEQLALAREARRHPPSINTTQTTAHRIVVLIVQYRLSVRSCDPICKDAPDALPPKCGSRRGDPVDIAKG